MTVTNKQSGKPINSQPNTQTSKKKKTDDKEWRKPVIRNQLTYQWLSRTPSLSYNTELAVVRPFQRSGPVLLPSPDTPWPVGTQGTVRHFCIYVMSAVVGRIS